MTLPEHHIFHVISQSQRVINFCEDAGIERKSIQASSYHYSTIPQIQDKQLDLDF